MAEPITVQRIRVAIDTLERALGGLSHGQRRSIAAFREDALRILRLDEDERQTQPSMLPAECADSNRSGVRGLWERQDEALTPVMRPARRAR